MARNLLGGFSGYSPVLSPAINGMILQLYLAARDPARPRLGIERDTLELNYSTSLYTLHQYFQSETHQKAVELLQKSIFHNKPFGLYLRSFAFGASVDPPQLDLNTIDTHVQMQDEHFQFWLTRYIVPKVPFLAIENPALELRTNNSLPKIALVDDSWQSVVKSIIPVATVIVLYFGVITDGVKIEIEAIRFANRQDSTILFHSEPIVDIDISDFPNVFSWKEENFDATAILSILQTLPVCNKDLCEYVILPVKPAPPSILKDYTDGITNMGLLAGHHMLKNSMYVDAVDAFVASIASSFWSQNEYARAFAYRYLACSFSKLNKLQLAIDILEYSLDLFEKFAHENPSSVAEALQNVNEFDNIFQQFSTISRVDHLQKRLSILQLK